MPIQVPVTFRGDADDLIDDIDRSLRTNVNRSFASFGHQAADRFSRVFSRDTRTFSDRFRSGFSGSFVSALQGVAIRDPRVFAVLGASIAALMPAVGTLAAGAFVLAFATGLVGLGFVFAAQNKQVKQTFKDLGSDIADTMREITKPLQGTLLVIADTARKTFNTFVPSLRIAFAQMAPVLNKFITELGKAFGELAPTIQPVTRAFIAILRDAGPRLVPFFKDLADSIINMARAVKRNPDIFNSIFGNILGLLPSLFNFLAWLVRAQKKMNDFFSALSNSKGADKFREILGNISDVARDFFNTLNRGNEVGKVFDAIRNFIEPLLPVFRATSEAVGTTLADGFHEIADVLNKDFLPAIRRLLPILAPVAKFILEILGRAVVGALKGAIQVIKGALTFISGLINLFVGVLTGDWSLAWSSLGQIVRGAFNIVVGAVRVFLNVTLIGMFRRFGVFLVSGLWKGLWRLLVAGTKAGFRGIISAFSGSLRAITRLISLAVRSYIRFWANMFRGIVAIVKNGWKVLHSAFGGGLRAILTVVVQTGQAIARAFVSAIRGMIGGVRSAWNAITNAVTNALTNIRKLVNALPGQLAAFIRAGVQLMVAAGIALLEGLLDGVLAGLAKVKNAIEDGLNWIANKLPGSPIKDGPLKHWNGGKPGRKLMELLAKGIRIGTPAFLKTAVKALSGLSDLVAKDLKKEDIGKKAAKVLQAQIRQISDVLSKEAALLASKLAERLNFVKGLRDQLKGQLSLTDILTSSGGDVTAFVSGVHSFAAGLKQFAERLGLLRKKGLHPALIAEIAGLGSVEGNKIAEVLLKATGAQTGQLNKAFGDINKFANQAGNEVATGLFGTIRDINRASRRRLQGDLSRVGVGRAQRINVTQNFYGPTTSGGRLREIDWTLRYATRGRRQRHEGAAD